MSLNKIAIIGGGNLGTAIAEGLISSGFILPDNIMITRRNVSMLADLLKKGVQISADNREAVRFADVVVLAVKPFQVQEVLTAIKDELVQQKHVLVSVITGVFIKDIYSFITNQLPVFRAMPNTAIAIHESM